MWNIRILYQPGKALILIKEVETFKIGVVALQEIRQNMEGSMEIGNTTI